MIQKPEPQSTYILGYKFIKFEGSSLNRAIA